MGIQRQPGLDTRGPPATRAQRGQPITSEFDVSLGETGNRVALVARGAPAKLDTQSTVFP